MQKIKATEANQRLTITERGPLTKEQAMDIERQFKHKPGMFTLLSAIGTLYPNETFRIHSTKHGDGGFNYTVKVGKTFWEKVGEMFG